MNTKDAIEKRRSIHKFKSKSIGFGKIIEIIDAGMQAPAAGNISGLRCIIIEDQETKNMLASASDQEFLQDASWLLVICSDDGRLETMYHDRANKYGRQQAGAAIQNMLLAATEMGIGSCWIGSFLDSKVRSTLDIPEEVVIEAIVALGQANEKPVKKRKVLESALFWEKWNQRKKPTYL